MDNIDEKVVSWISVGEAAEVSGYSREWIRNIAREGDVNSKKLHMSTAVLIDKDSLIKYMVSKRQDLDRR